jgi:hypothetical protein
MTLTISCKAFFVIANSLDESKKMIGQAVAIILSFYFIVNMLATFWVYGRKNPFSFLFELITNLFTAV